MKISTLKARRKQRRQLATNAKRILLRIDPTRTLTLRKAMFAELKQRFDRFKVAVIKLVSEENAFGFTHNTGEPEVNTRFSFNTDPAKVTAFKDWIAKQIKADILKSTEDELYRKYAEAGLKKGAGRAFDDIKKPYAKGYAADQSTADFYAKSKEDFLNTAFNQPVAIEKVKLLAGRTYNELEGVTDAMSQQMTRTLTDGLVKGDSPLEVAKDLADDVDGIGIKRAEVIARTEIIRAHAEGQLDAMEAMGVTELGVAVEWSVSGLGMTAKKNPSPCTLCAPLEGIVLTIDEARGLIPRHPNCMCSFIPNTGQPGKDTKAEIDDAIKESLAEDSDNTNWPGADVEIEAKRPMMNATTLPKSEWRSLELTAEQWGRLTLTQRANILLENVFCPTGIGGGVNPHCSPSGGKFLTPSGHDVHTADGLVDYIKEVQGFAGNQLYKGINLDKIRHLNPNGIQNGEIVLPRLFHMGGKVDVNKMAEAAQLMADNLPAGTLIKTKNVTAKDMAPKAAAPTPAAPTPAAPVAPVAAPKPASTSTRTQVPHQDNTEFESGKPQSNLELNGVPFEPAPPKFWEHTKDVTSFKEPPALKHIDRVGVMIKEPDGRIWIVQPTNAYGRRNYTIPGGTVEPGLSNQQNALKEVWEETGLQVKITGHLGDFTDSNTKAHGRLYVGERIGGAPWDAKPEAHIPASRRNGSKAESEAVNLVTPEKAASLLHRTDDLAQLATINPIKLNTKTSGEMMNKLYDGLQPAAKTFKGKGDATLNAVQNLRGFNDKPALVDKSDMDKLVKQGTHIELLRGINDGGGKTGQQLAEQFKTGNHFPGFGVFGNGTYADATKGSGSATFGHGNVVGQNYGTGGTAGVIRMALPKTAKIIKQSELEKAVPSAPFKYNPGGYAGTTDENWKGVQAALAGYDAIHVDGNSRRHGSYGNPKQSSTEGFYVILNRSILTVQKEDAKGHVIK